MTNPYIIQNGTVLTNGKQLPNTDIYVVNGEIAGIKNSQHDWNIVINKNAQIIDATGKYVTPGFINGHDHSDLEVLTSPSYENYFRQGFTTIVLGNCGVGAAPMCGYSSVLQMMGGQDIGRVFYESFETYIDELKASSPPMNIAPLLATGSVWTMLREKFDVKNLSEIPPEALNKAREYVIKAVNSGSVFGLSTGFAYETDSHITNAEYFRYVFGELPSGNMLHKFHVRNQSGYGLLGAVKEAVRICELEGNNLHIAHLKVKGRSNKDQINSVIAAIENAGGTFAAYPYLEMYTSLMKSFDDKLLQKKDSELEFQKALINIILGNSKFSPGISLEQSLTGQELLDKWKGVKVAFATQDFSRQFLGKSIYDITNQYNKGGSKIKADEVKNLMVSSGVNSNFYDFAENIALVIGSGALEPHQMAALIILTDPLVKSTYLTMEEEITQSIFAQGLKSGIVIPEPDSHVSLDIKNGGSPRWFTFSGEMMQQRANLGYNSVAQLVETMTSLPAKIYGIPNKGSLKKGMDADIAIFKDLQPQSDNLGTTGVEYLFVNGVPVIINFELDITVNSGRVLNRNNN